MILPSRTGLKVKLKDIQEEHADVILHECVQCMCEHHLPSNQIITFIEEATQTDFEHMLKVIKLWFDATVRKKRPPTRVA